jgi:hypothetical protein
MTCPYCNQRTITMTLCTAEGTYSCCNACGVAWGLKAQAFEAGAEVRLLEWWYSLPDAQEVR